MERQDLVIRGVAIHNYRMAKALDLNSPHLSWPGGRIWTGGLFVRDDLDDAAIAVLEHLFPG